MKNKYLLALTLATGLSLQSCGDFLDTKPAAIYSVDLVWGSAANVRAFVYGKYSTAIGFYRNNSMTDVNFTPNMIW